jgi:hypothetical protein
MDFYLEFIYQPLLPILSVRSLIMFTSCNKFLYSLSETFIKDKCLSLYAVENPRATWRYTLSLLKYGKRDIPIIVNLINDNKVTLKSIYSTTIYADDINPVAEYYSYVEASIDKYSTGYLYHKSCFQLVKENSDLVDNLLTTGIEFYGDYHNISNPRTNCQRFYDILHLNNEKYIGLSKIYDKTIFEAIASIDIFMLDY